LPQSSLFESYDQLVERAFENERQVPFGVGVTRKIAGKVQLPFLFRAQRERELVASGRKRFESW
jgi:plasmid maintenance system killer protein